MRVVNVQEAKTHLSRFIERAYDGEEFIIGKYGRLMVKLTAYTLQREKRPLGGFED